MLKNYMSVFCFILFILMAAVFLVDGQAESPWQMYVVNFEGTVWLSQAEMALLFQTIPQAITQHLRTIYQEEELSEKSTCKDFLQVRMEGSREVRRTITTYDLKAITAVGYRVRSARGTQSNRTSRSNCSNDGDFRPNISKATSDSQPDDRRGPASRSQSVQNTADLTPTVLKHSIACASLVEASFPP